MTSVSGWRLSATQSLIGGLAAGALAYLAALFSARLLGPDGFGRISLALIVAQILSLLVVRGLDFSSAREVVLAPAPEDKKRVVGTAYVVVAAGALVGGLLLILLSTPISAAVGWSSLSLAGAGLFLLPVSLRAVNERLLPALDLTRMLATFRPIEGLLLLGGLGLLSMTNAVTPVAVLSVMVVSASLVGAALVLGAVRRRMVGPFDSSTHRRLTPYAKVVLAISLVPLPLQFGDRFVIQTRLSEADLGLYIACATATQLLGAQVVALLSGVILPQVLRGGPPAVHRLRLSSGLILVPAAVVLAVVLWVSLLVLGTSYSPPTELVLLFAGIGALTLVNGLLHIAVLAHPKTLRLDVRLTAIRALIYLVVLVLLASMGFVTLVTVACTLLVSEAVQTLLLVWLTARAAETWDPEVMAGGDPP